MIELLRSAIDDYLALRGAPPGVAVAAVGRTTPIGSGLTLDAGSSDLITAQPVSDGTRFCIGSVSKTFTATLMAYAIVTQGVRVDDSVVPYLERLGVRFDAPAPLAAVRLIDLATHTAGMPDGAAGGGVPLFSDQTPVGTALATRWQAYRPPAGGLPARWRYSNLGYVTLGFAVSGMFGRTSNAYVDLLRSHVTGPLGMPATLPHPQLGRAAGYAWKPSPGHRQPHRQPVDGEPPDLWSTSSDLLAFLRAQLGDPESPRSSELAKALALTRESHGSFTVAGHPDRSMNMGLAWQRYVGIDGGVVLRKNGALAGFTSDVQLQPDRGIGVAVMVNQSWPSHPRPPKGCLPADLAATLLSHLRAASQP